MPVSFLDFRDLDFAEPEMVIRIFLFRDDVSNWLGGSIRSIFVHADCAVVDLHQVIWIIAPGVPDHDAPSRKIFPIEKWFPAVLPGYLIAGCRCWRGNSSYQTN